jgi:transglutaminase-like putative cysteine protease
MAEDTTAYLVEKALEEINFYNYNMAYSSIMKIENEDERNSYLIQLSDIEEQVLTPTVITFTKQLENLVSTSSGRLYDEMVTELSDSTLCDVDKGYLLGELTGWGKTLVYTEDYIAAVDAVIVAWNEKEDESIAKAEILINRVENEYSMEYLLEQLSSIKESSTESESVINTKEKFTDLIEDSLKNFEERIEFEAYANSFYESIDLDVINEIISSDPTIDGAWYKGAILSYMTSSVDSSIKKCTLTFKYTKTREEMLSMKEEVENKASEIIGDIIEDGMSDYKKERAIHDYIVNNTVYDYENYIQDTIPDESHSDYGALINGIAVCDGYAKAAYRLLTLAGIECYYVIGYADGNGHAWNIVKINDVYYHLDVTWDDPVLLSGGNLLIYDYFNISSSEMSIDHSWNINDYPGN